MRKQNDTTYKITVTLSEQEYKDLIYLAKLTEMGDEDCPWCGAKSTRQQCCKCKYPRTQAEEYVKPIPPDEFIVECLQIVIADRRKSWPEIKDAESIVEFLARKNKAS